MSRDPVVPCPAALSAGSRVALVAPAGPIDGKRIERSAARCRALGLEPVIFPHAAARDGFLAGSDAQRLGDLQAAFDDPTLGAIWALRGGYGTLRILERLDLGRQRKAPIPYIGFSDHTTVHARHARMGVISFHGPHPGGSFPPETESWFRRVLFSPAPPGELPTRTGDPEPVTLVSGAVTAPLVGGNLSMLAALCGSQDGLDARGRICFLEDVGERAYRIDRMLVQLERAGALEGLAGLAVGRFTETPDDDEAAVRDVIRRFAERLGVPAVADLPFGHVEHNCVLPVGALARLNADERTLSLTEAAVAGPGVA